MDFLIFLSSKNIYLMIASRHIFFSFSFKPTNTCCCMVSLLEKGITFLSILNILVSILFKAASVFLTNFLAFMVCALQDVESISNKLKNDSIDWILFFITE